MIQKLKQKLHYGTDIIEYYVIKSRRVKTSEIIIDKEQIIIRTPHEKPISEIKEIVRNKATWILKKQLEYKKSSAEILKPIFEEGSSLPFLGNNYPLKIIVDNNKKEKYENDLEFIGGQFLIRKSNNKSKTSKNKIRSLYEQWLIDKAEPIFTKKVRHYSEELAVSPKKIVIKDLKNRWGSATKDNTININLNLIKAPQGVIDYLILHELCHLKIKEHSHHYWNLLHKLMPNYQEKIDWLKVNGTDLIL